MNGTDVILSVDQTDYAGQTTTDLNFETEMIDTTTKLTGKWKTFIPGENSATISVEGLFNLDETGGGKESFQDLKNGTQVTLNWGNNTDYWEANAYISSVSISAGKNDNATASVELQITGEPTFKHTTST